MTVARRAPESVSAARPAPAATAAPPAAFCRAVERRIMRIAFAAAVVLVTVQTLLHLVNAFLLDYRIWNFSADADGNAVSWLNALVLAAAAAGAAALAAAVPERRRMVGALAVVLGFFSLDDIVAAHETLGEVIPPYLGLPDENAGRVLWPVFFFPLLGFAFLALWRVSRSAPARVGAFLRIALVALVCAILVEVVWVAWYVRGGETETGPDSLQVVLEEGLELGAWVVVAGALFATAAAPLLTAYDRALDRHRAQR